MTITSEAVQRYARIVLYWVAGYMVNRGVLSGSGTDAFVGVGLSVVNFAWTLYGNRIVAKLNEVAKMGVVTNVVVNDKAVADATVDKVISK